MSFTQKENPIKSQSHLQTKIKWKPVFRFDNVNLLIQKIFLRFLQEERVRVYRHCRSSGRVSTVHWIQSPAMSSWNCSPHRKHYVFPSAAFDAVGSVRSHTRYFLPLTSPFSLYLFLFYRRSHERVLNGDSVITCDSFRFLFRFTSPVALGTSPRATQFLASLCHCVRLQ